MCNCLCPTMHFTMPPFDTASCLPVPTWSPVKIDLFTCLMLSVIVNSLCAMWRVNQSMMIYPFDELTAPLFMQSQHSVIVMPGTLGSSPEASTGQPNRSSPGIYISVLNSIYIYLHLCVLQGNGDGVRSVERGVVQPKWLRAEIYRLCVFWSINVHRHISLISYIVVLYGHKYLAWNVDLIVMCMPVTALPWCLLANCRLL